MRPTWSRRTDRHTDYFQARPRIALGFDRRDRRPVQQRRIMTAGWAVRAARLSDPRRSTLGRRPAGFPFAASAVRGKHLAHDGLGPRVGPGPWAHFGHTWAQTRAIPANHIECHSAGHSRLGNPDQVAAEGSSPSARTPTVRVSVQVDAISVFASYRRGHRMATFWPHFRVNTGYAG